MDSSDQQLDRIHQLLIEDAIRGFADIAAGRTVEAHAALAQIQKRRAAALPPVISNPAEKSD